MDENERRKIIVPRFEISGGFSTLPRYSNIMKKIKGKNTKPEVIFRKELWRLGIRYRLKNADLPGKPDIVIKRNKLVIFIDGDFWHGYNWQEKKCRLKRNVNYWIPKIERNMQRDLEINSLLKSKGWTVLRFWEYQIKKELSACIKSVVALLI